MFLEAEASTAGNLLSLFMPFIIMLVLLYFFLIRPQQKQQKERQTMIEALKKGDQVVTIGGIHGEITAITDDIITLRVTDNTEIKLSRSGVSSVAR